MDILDWLYEKGAAAQQRPRGNTVLRQQIARYRMAQTLDFAEARSIAAKAAEHPDPEVRKIAAALAVAVA